MAESNCDGGGKYRDGRGILAVQHDACRYDSQKKGRKFGTVTQQQAIV